MRSYRRTGSRRGGRSDGSFWLSFSDLMSSLVIVFILVMFYIIYQYFDLAELNQAEIARREYQLEETQTALESQQSKLTEAEKQMIAQQILLDAKEKELTSAQDILESQKAELAAAQTQLTDKETEISTQQAQLDALSAQLTTQQTQLTEKETQLTTAQDQLAVQQSQLADAQTQLATQQFQLSEQEAALVLAQRQLSDQEAELLLAQAQLAAHEAELADAQTQIDSQQAQLSTQQAQLDNQQAQIEQLVGMKTRIITSLSNALRESNISATVDPANGSIALKSDVLFESGQYKLSSRGKRFIDSFLPVYLNVLFSEEYKPYIAEIIVEGHTDSDGGYMSNLELSQQRALAVASYVLGDSCKAVESSVKMQLRPVMTVNGRSYSDLITDERGREDKDASRRVVFKFRLTDEQMIQQLRQILENQ